MKIKITCLTLAALFFILSSSAVLAEEKFPNLVGKWTGQTRIGHSLANGFGSEHGGLTIDIAKQEGRLFTGNKIIKHFDIKKKNVTTKEPISGVITTDGKTLYIADRDFGVTIGNIISEDNIEFYYIQSGKKEGQFVSYYNFKKIKQ